MNWIYIGEIVNTHGLKGEVRILSDFQYKNKAFVPGKKMYIGKNKEVVTMKSYRVHKNYDMVTFTGLEDINDVIIYKGEKAYMNRDEIGGDGYFKEDLMGLDVYQSNQLIGTVSQIMISPAHDILVVTSKEKKHLIPYVEPFIERIDLEQKKIYICVIEGLLNEN